MCISKIIFKTRFYCLYIFYLVCILRLLTEVTVIFCFGINAGRFIILFFFFFNGCCCFTGGIVHKNWKWIKGIEAIFMKRIHLYRDLLKNNFEVNLLKNFLLKKKSGFNFKIDVFIATST